MCEVYHPSSLIIYVLDRRSITQKTRPACIKHVHVLSIIIIMSISIIGIMSTTVKRAEVP